MLVEGETLGLRDSLVEGEDDALRDGLTDGDRDSDVLGLLDADRLGEVLELPDSLVEGDRDADKLELVEDEAEGLADGDVDATATHVSAAKRYRTTPSEKVTGMSRFTPRAFDAPVVMLSDAPASMLRSASFATRRGPPTDVGVQAMRDLLSGGKGDRRPREPSAPDHTRRRRR